MGLTLRGLRDLAIRDSVVLGSARGRDERRIEAARGSAPRTCPARRRSTRSPLGHEPLRVVGRVAAHHADRQRLGDVLGDRQQLRHRLERLAEVVLVEAGDDDALAAVGERRCTTAGRSGSKNCPSSMPTTSVSRLDELEQLRASCRPRATESASRCARRCGRRRSACRSIGLKICTLWRAICARRSRRISSSLLPLNMLPTMTSIQPWLGCADDVHVIPERSVRVATRVSTRATGIRRFRC